MLVAIILYSINIYNQSLYRTRYYFCMDKYIKTHGYRTDIVNGEPVENLRQECVKNITFKVWFSDKFLNNNE